VSCETGSASLAEHAKRIHTPLCCIYRTVIARIWPWLPDKRPENVSSCSIFAQIRYLKCSRVEASELRDVGGWLRQSG